jgi:hypothetical protein
MITCLFGFQMRIVGAHASELWSSDVIKVEFSSDEEGVLGHCYLDLLRVGVHVCVRFGYSVCVPSFPPYQSGCNNSLLTPDCWLQVALLLLYSLTHTHTHIHISFSLSCSRLSLPPSCSFCSFCCVA